MILGILASLLLMICFWPASIPLGILAVVLGAFGRAKVCLSFLVAMIASQISSANAGRHWFHVGIETAALLACFAALV